MILLDIMLPFVSGIEVCRTLRNQKKTPVIMLTARDTVTDRISGLDSGADDYIPKPFAIEELLARMRALFRRVEMQDISTHQKLVFRHLNVGVDARVVYKGNHLIDMTKREFDLLVMFMRHLNLALTRDMLMGQVWGHDSLAETNVVDLYVRYLRIKLDDSGTSSFIQTIRGVGYVMR